MKNLSLTDLLIRAKVDDIDNQDIYFTEINSRNPSEKEMNKAYRMMTLIIDSRNKRAKSGLNIFSKLFIIVFPFLVFSENYRYYDEFYFDELRLRGYIRKINQVNYYAVLGCAVYLFLILMGFYYSEEIKTAFKSKRPIFITKNQYDFNDFRKANHIPLLPENWESETSLAWFPSDKINKPYHAGKYLKSNSELDVFLNETGKNYDLVLEIEYIFYNVNAGINPWRCYLTERVKENSCQILENNKQLNRIQADSVLIEWNINPY